SFDSSSSIAASSGNRLISCRTSGLSYDVTKPYDASVVKNGWTDTDIAAPTPLTTTIYDPNVNIQSLLAGGSGFTGSSDQLNLESQDITGNGLISAQVATLATGNASAKAGVMMRDGTATGALFAAVVEQTNKQVMFIYRNAAGTPAVVNAAVGDITNAKYV